MDPIPVRPRNACSVDGQPRNAATSASASRVAPGSRISPVGRTHGRVVDPLRRETTPEIVAVDERPEIAVVTGVVAAHEVARAYRPERPFDRREPFHGIRGSPGSSRSIGSVP